MEKNIMNHNDFTIDRNHASEQKLNEKTIFPIVRKTFRMVVALTFMLVLLLLCGCQQKFVGEEQAKKAGLALLRQAFGVTAQDAHVEYFERAGSSVVDNKEVQPGGETPDQIYLVTISDQTLGADLYYAEVDAKTGIAYYATKNEWLLAPQTPKQQQSTENNSQSDGTDADASLENECAKDTACDFVVRRFQREVALISAQGCCQRDHLPCARGSVGYFVTFADGGLYRVGFSWPAMDLNEVQVLGNDPKGERP